VTAIHHHTANTAQEACVAGEITYIDKNRVTRRTGFLWIYDPATGLFEKSKDTHHFFED
jgi:hypothetical protein